MEQEVKKTAVEFYYLMYVYPNPLIKYITIQYEKKQIIDAYEKLKQIILSVNNYYNETYENPKN